MKPAILLLFLVASVSAKADSDPPFIDMKKYDASILQDIRYATENNFTKKQVYPESKCVLRKPVGEALSRVQAAVKIQGYSLKVYDCYRPLSVQKKFWELVPDERYVANPAKGSRHNRGAAVDLTLVNREGNELEMPSGYDDFSEKAHRVQKKMGRVARQNMQLLEKAMVKEGFIPFETEWWHFDYKGWENYPLADVPFSSFP